MRPFFSLIAILSLLFALLPSRLPAQEEGTEPGAAPPQQDGDGASGEAAKPESTTEIKLLEAGSEDRSELRYSLTAGSEQFVQVVSRGKMEMKIGDFSVPSSNVPVQHLTFKLAPGEKKESGEYSVAFEIVATDVEAVEGVAPFMLEQQRKSIQGLVGVKGSFVVTTRGVTRSTEIDIPETAPRQVQMLASNIKSSLYQIAHPLPQEAVGVGAKWEAKQALEQAGMKIQQTSTYELVSLEDETASVKFTVRQDAPKQKFSPPGAPPGAEAEVDSFDGDGSGSYTFRLSAISPVEARIQLKTEMQTSTAVQGQKQTITLKYEIESEMSEKSRDEVEQEAKKKASGDDGKAAGENAKKDG